MVDAFRRRNRTLKPAQPAEESTCAFVQRRRCAVTDRRDVIACAPDILGDIGQHLACVGKLSVLTHDRPSSRRSLASPINRLAVANVCAVSSTQSATADTSPRQRKRSRSPSSYSRSSVRVTRPPFLTRAPNDVVVVDRLDVVAAGPADGKQHPTIGHDHKRLMAATGRTRTFPLPAVFDAGFLVPEHVLRLFVRLQ